MSDAEIEQLKAKGNTAESSNKAERTPWDLKLEHLQMPEDQDYGDDLLTRQ
jgi:hypothetical protein